MNLLPRSLGLSAVVLLLTTHPLPAPIQEVPENATPVPEQSAKPKPRRVAKPKATTEDWATTGEQTKSPAIPSSTKQPPPSPSRFAGTWSGIVNVPNPLVGGNSNCTYIINAADNSVKESCERFRENTSAATVNGNTISWKNGVFKEYNNSLTLIGDGRTAQITITSSWGSGSGTVSKTGPAVDFPSPAVAREKRGGIPTAKPVPDKPGFVYDPFDPSSKMFLDVRGKPSGIKVKDPSGRLFIVP